MSPPRSPRRRVRETEVVSLLRELGPLSTGDIVARFPDATYEHVYRSLRGLLSDAQVQVRTEIRGHGNARRRNVVWSLPDEHTYFTGCGHVARFLRV